jgi:protein-tyrosine phosphatase
VNARLEAEGLTLRVIRGAEVALSRLPEFDDEQLEQVCLGAGRYILVESPYFVATDTLENMLFSLQLRGFRPVLAHPERSPSLMEDISRLAVLADRGIICSVTAASMTGRFGRTVQRATRAMFERGLVHNVASDAHDDRRRPPGLRDAFSALDHLVPGVHDEIDWYTREVPAAVLAGAQLPPRPARSPRRGRWLRGRSKTPGR